MARYGRRHADCVRRASFAPRGGEETTMTDRIISEQLGEGMNVYGADGDKVGSIVAVDPRYLVVEKGFFFPTDYYIPISAIARIDPDRDEVWLTVDKDAALNQGWDVAPTADAVATGEAVVTDA